MLPTIVATGHSTGARVAPVIEYSKDGGTTWTTAYDANYRPATASSGETVEHSSPSARED
jgi:hypothetical protein